MLNLGALYTIWLNPSLSSSAPMTKLCFTFTTSNVLLGLVCVRVSGLGSGLHSVNNMGVWRNLVGKLAVHGALVGNV